MGQMRLSGLISGMDTDSIITQLVSARRQKVKKLTNEQTKMSWKQDLWKDVNKQLKSLQSTLGNMRFTADYLKKTTTSSAPNKVSVMTSNNAVNAVQSLKVEKLAKTAYLTGGTVEKTDGSKADALTKMSDLGFSGAGSIKLTMDGKETDIDINGDSTINDVLSKLQNKGLNASFDSSTQRLFISSKTSGAKNDFTLTASGDGADALAKLGLQTKDYYAGLTSYTQADVDASVAARMDSLLKNYNKQMSSKKDLTDQISSLQDEIAELEGKTGETEEETEEIAKSLQEKKDSLAAKQTELEKLQENITKTEANFAPDSISSETDAEGNTIYTAEASDSLKAAAEADLKKRIDDAAAIAGDTESSKFASKIDGADASILLNGARFTGSTNVFDINGLTITANGVTAPDEEITLTTQNDTSGVYDMIKGFLSTYNSVVNKLDSLYNAPSAKGYEPLSDEEKEAMSETEAEKYEQKIKDALLKGDDTVGSITNALANIMSGGVEVNGKRMYLSDFGINTLSYFSAPDNEKRSYHIDGDEKDENTSANADKLKAMITKDPDTITAFFSKLSQDLYKKMSDMSTSVNGYRSFGSFYNDKRMTTDYSEYKTKISDMEEKVNAYEDKLYKQYAAMEKALAKMQSNTSAVSALVGGGN